jgi:hypothetical protein
MASRPEVEELRWRKSSRSGGSSGSCVEIANVPAIRDSKNATGPILKFDESGLSYFLAAVKAGRF